MRRIGWIVAVVFFGVISQVMAAQSGCAGCNGGKRAQQGFGAEACASPAGHALAPGCCETNRRCCDNVWVGYCDRRAQVEAFWDAVGTSGGCMRWYARRAPVCATPMPTPTPNPAPTSPCSK